VQKKADRAHALYIICGLVLCILLSGCAAKKRRYHHRHDHGPRQHEIPARLHAVKDAVPRHEPRSKYGNPASYKVMRKRYHVMKCHKGFRERGLASWYGKKFHGYRTSSGDIYDMYGMTAAHKNLPLPTYVKVVNLDNGKTAIVKVNDRGPFHRDRIIDLSYAAAHKLGILGNGTAKVEVIALEPDKYSQQHKQHKQHTARNKLLITKQAKHAKHSKNVKQIKHKKIYRR
jgi:rare lipoprotein A